MGTQRIIVFGLLVCIILIVICLQKVYRFETLDSVKDIPVARPNQGELSNLPTDPLLLEKMRKFAPLDLPSKEKLREMSKDHLKLLYYSYIGSGNIVCRRRLRMGLIGDGGYEICDDEPYRPIEPCIVYSFGIRDDFSFDDDMAKFYKCQVFSFDPSMKSGNHSHSPTVHFYRIGIRGGETKHPPGWQLNTLKAIKEDLHHAGKAIDVLKIDTEAAEWRSLRHAIDAGILTNVRQLFVEFHTYPPFIPDLSFLYFLEVLADLEKIGFRKYYVDRHHFMSLRTTFTLEHTQFHEVHYVNINFKH